MPGSALGSILFSGLAGFFAGYVVLRLARGSWVARASLGALAVACFIASAIVVKMAFEASHSEGLGGLFFFVVGIYAAVFGFGLLITIFLPVRRPPQ